MLLVYYANSTTTQLFYQCYLKKIINKLNDVFFYKKLNNVLSRQLINMKTYELSYSLIDVATHH